MRMEFYGKKKLKDCRSNDRDKGLSEEWIRLKKKAFS